MMYWPMQFSVGNFNLCAVGVTGTLEEWPRLPFHLWGSSHLRKLETHFSSLNG